MKPLCVLLVLWYASYTNAGQPPPTRAEVAKALDKATRFMHEKIADHGGYAWTSSVDGKFRHGEGVAAPGTIWIQPPGTPAVGMAFLEAYEATGGDIHLKAAQDAALALVKGQLRSGGWNYRVEFDPRKRSEFIYRDSPLGGRAHIPPTPSPGGWDIWKQRKFKADMTILDDDTTPAALRLLMRVDQALKFKHPAIHEAAEYALASTLKAQYPIGAWSHNYDRFPLGPVSAAHYPILKASYPVEWSRTWTKDFTGCYMLNDRITQNMIATMLLAYRIYGDKHFLDSAHRGGKFLLLAQLPDPQPAWAQEYNRAMEPVWDRPFEPPAITGLESQDVLDTLLLLHRETGDRTYLELIPPALAYLKKSLLSDGKLARFYELRTNKPLYFTKNYKLTYNKDNVPTHYGFTFPSRLDAIDALYRKQLAMKPEALLKPVPEIVNRELNEAVTKILTSQSPGGAWTEPGMVRDHAGRKLTPPEGVVQSPTFIDNVRVLCRYLHATGGK